MSLLIFMTFISVNTVSLIPSSVTRNNYIIIMRTIEDQPYYCIPIAGSNLALSPGPFPAFQMLGMGLHGDEASSNLLVLKDVQ